MYKQYVIHTIHYFFEMCNRKEDNLALKSILKTILQKCRLSDFEKTKEETYAENLRAEKEVNFVTFKLMNVTMMKRVLQKTY